MSGHVDASLFGAWSLCPHCLADSRNISYWVYEKRRWKCSDCGGRIGLGEIDRITVRVDMQDSGLLVVNIGEVLIDESTRH